MKQTFTISKNQLQELDTFYDRCMTDGIEFENYHSLCEEAKVFKKDIEKSNMTMESSVAMLAFAALIKYRKDDLLTVLKRDFENSKNVRLNFKLLKELSK